MAAGEKDSGKDPTEDRDDKKEDAGDDTGRPEDTIPRTGRHRPSPTIDLKAEEVDEDAAKAEADEPSGDGKAEENETTPEKHAGSSPKDPTEDRDDKKEDAGDDAGRPEDTIPRTGRRRPSPTIDLKAEEVDEDAAKAETDEPSGDGKAEENETTPEKHAGSSPKDPTEDRDDKKEDAGDDAGRPEDTIPRTGRRRPSPTIDLKAEEVDEDAAKAETDEPSGDGKVEENETTPEKDAGSSPKDTGAPPDTGELPDEPPQRTTPGDVRGFATHLAAGLVGGVIGVVGVGIGLDKLPFATLTGEAQSNAETAASDALGARLAALETKVTTLGETARTTDSLPAESLTALEERVAGAEEGLVAIKGFPGAMTERVVRLEAALKTLGETAAEGGDVAQQAAFESQMNALEQRLEERVEAVEKSVAEARTDMPDGGDLAALRNDLEEVKSALTEISSGSGNGELQADVARRLADVEKQVAGLGSGTPQAGSGTGGAALAIGFAGLTGAIARGEPFLRELETLKTMAPAGLDLTSLEASAATGAPTLTELQQSFRVLAPTARDAARNRQSDNSLVGQLVSRARTIVRVERIDAGAAGGAAATLSGMAEHLKSGDLNAVIAESEKLPDAVRAAMGSWLDQARTRLELDSSVKQLTARLAEILARSPAPKSGN